jgi:hypothetical protein
MPQFVLFTHDDATDQIANQLVNQTVEGLTNPNGCRIPTTFFTMEVDSYCDQVQTAWKLGNEIATHTVNHLAMPIGFKGGAGSVEAEIVGARTWLINTCGIPADDVVGFRAPYLVYNPPYFQTLSTNGFLYDSSINEHWPMPTSPSGSSRLWPYTMDAGIPQDCAWITGDSCTTGEAFKGLWEVPIWVIQNDSYPAAAYAMDPCSAEFGAEPCNFVPFYQEYFKLAYNGNKAPVPIYIHTPWLTNYSSDVRQFMQWVTQNYPDAYFVTMRQLIQWIQNPVPKSQMNEWLGCVQGGRAAGAPGAGPSNPTSTPSPSTPSPSSTSSPTATPSLSSPSTVAGSPTPTQSPATGSPSPSTVKPTSSPSPAPVSPVSSAFQAVSKAALIMQLCALALAAALLLQ